MKATIDRAGRVVIPAKLRARAGLEPGEALDITFENGSLRIERDVMGPELVRVGKRLVARPRVAKQELPEVDIAALVREERDR